MRILGNIVRRDKIDHPRSIALEGLALDDDYDAICAAMVASASRIYILQVVSIRFFADTPEWNYFFRMPSSASSSTRSFFGHEATGYKGRALELVQSILLPRESPVRLRITKATEVPGEPWVKLKCKRHRVQSGK